MRMGTILRSKMEGLYPEGLPLEKYSIAFGRIGYTYPWVWDLYEYVDNTDGLSNSAREINGFIDAFLKKLDKMSDYEVRKRTNFNSQLELLVFKTDSENIEEIEKIHSRWDNQL